MSDAFVVDEWTPVARNTLIGFARVRLPSGMVLHDVSIHHKGGAVWASPAAKPILDHDGSALRNAAGKLQYVPVVSFASRDVRDRWSAAVIDALRLRHPSVLP
jgi:hypothetical protein